MSFPFGSSQRQTVRAPINPLDKATIVSIYPKQIEEYKCTIDPGNFLIPAGTKENPGILHIGPSSWWKDVDLNQPLLEIPVSAIRIAESVINDYCNGLLACNMGGRMPGLFYLPGALKADIIKKEYSAQLLAAEIKQRAWYEELITISDVLWARSNGNPLSISDDAKLAAKELSLWEMKPWTKNAVAVSMRNCPACGTLVNPGYPVCGNCKTIIDKAKYDTMGLSMMKVG